MFGLLDEMKFLALHHNICNVQRLSWAVALLVILINGYVLVDFFRSEVKGWLYGIVSCFMAVAYVAFLLYLIFRGKMQRDLFAYMRT